LPALEKLEKSKRLEEIKFGRWRSGGVGIGDEKSAGVQN
jgi:hypothetical protein